MTKVDIASKMTKQDALKKYFGYETFYPLQAEIIDHIMAGKHALVLMPTGGGKSVCFQIPALIMDGMAIIISPLIALMKDQVDFLAANGISAAFLNSTQTEDESAAIVSRCLKGDIKLLYISPERLAAASTIGFLQKLRVSLFAVDEAHCISSWGHDFRPDYQKLHVLREKFPAVPLIALTATADRVIRKDILRQLDIPEEHQFIASFDRPNLSLSVYSGQKRLEQILRFLSKRKNQTGIIYCLSRKTTENVARGFGIAVIGRLITMPVWIMTSEVKFRTRLSATKFRLSAPPSPSAWALINRISAGLFITACRKISKAIIRKSDGPGVTARQADTVLFYSYADVKTHHDMIKDSPASKTGTALGQA